MDVRKVPSPVKRVVHLGSRSYGRLTAPGRMTPSFLICGGQRCGTTSLYRALAAHPAVLKAVLHKGVHYFDISYDRGMALVQGALPAAAQRRARSTTKHGVPAQTFESSPYYMYHPQAAARIAADLPAAKLWCWSATRSNGRTRSTTTRWRAASRPSGTSATRWRWSRPGCTARRTSSPPTRRTTRSRTSTTPTGPAASTPATSA